MSSRMPLLTILFLGIFSSSVAAETLGPNKLGFEMFGAHTHFDEEIRFDDDFSLGAALRLGFSPWFGLGIELSTARLRDAERDVQSQAIFFGVNARFEPWRAKRFGLGALVGVSFMAFEESANTDSISEGFELAPSFLFLVSDAWTLRADLMFRLQTFRVILVDETGQRIGDSFETGYLWSRALRVGLGYAF